MEDRGETDGAGEKEGLFLPGSRSLSLDSLSLSLAGSLDQETRAKSFF